MAREDSNLIVCRQKNFSKDKTIKYGAIEDVENSIFQLCFAYSTVFLNLNPIFLHYNLESYRLEAFQLVQQFKRLLHSSLAISFSSAQKTAPCSITNIVSCLKRSASVPKRAPSALQSTQIIVLAAG